MARKTRRIKKRRSRFSTAVLQGIGICFVVYFPAAEWGNPMIPMGMASLMMILIAVRLKTGRQGFIRGLILGTIAGIWLWAGMVNRLDKDVAYREWQTEAHEIPTKTGESADATMDSDNASQPEQQDDAGTDVAEDDSPPTEPARMTEVVPYTQEERDYHAKLKSQLPYRTIPPPMVICPLIGMVFANLANKRRIKARSMWD